MKLKIPNHGSGEKTGGFTLVETIVASALAGVLMVAATGGFWSGFAAIQVDRENSRATQILLEKTELIRLYNWDQIIGNDTNIFVPATFTAPFYPDSASGGFTYSGTAEIRTIPNNETYSSDVRLIRLTLTWTSGKRTRSRTMSTYVSRYGMQNYFY